MLEKNFLIGLLFFSPLLAVHGEDMPVYKTMVSPLRGAYVVEGTGVVKAIKYDEQSRTLMVGLAGGDVLMFRQILSDLVQQFMDALSKDVFFEEKIKAAYESIRIMSRYSK